MTAKQYLRQIQSIENRIDRIRQQLHKIGLEMDTLKSPDYGKDRIASTSSGDQMINMIIRYDEQYSKLMREMRRLLEVRTRICDEIEQLSDDRYKKILFERYVMHRTWEDVAEITGYETRYVYDLHSKALDAFTRQQKQSKTLH